MSRTGWNDTPAAFADSDGLSFQMAGRKMFKNFKNMVEKAHPALLEPMAEMLAFPKSLNSITSARGSYSTEFSHHGKVSAICRRSSCYKPLLSAKGYQEEQMESWFGILVFTLGVVTGVVATIRWRRFRQLKSVDVIGHFLTNGLSHEDLLEKVGFGQNNRLSHASMMTIPFLPLIATALERRQPLTQWEADWIEAFVAAHSFQPAVPELLLLLHSSVLAPRKLLSSVPVDTTLEKDTSPEQSYVDGGTFGWEEGIECTIYTYELHWVSDIYEARRPVADGAVLALLEVRKACTSEGMQAMITQAIEVYKARPSETIETRRSTDRRLIEEAVSRRVTGTGRNL